MAKRYGALLSLAFLLASTSDAQRIQSATTPSGDAKIAALVGSGADVFGFTDRFIENAGQYGHVVEGHGQFGQIQFGYEGLDMPALFTSKGVLFLQRRVDALPHEERERLEAQGLTEEEINVRTTVTDKVMRFEWLGGDPFATFTYEDATEGYHTYGQLTQPARGFKRVRCKDLWPGIDLIYTLSSGKRGFEYSFVVHAGADATLIAMHCGGDVRKVRMDRDGKLLMHSDINGIEQSAPVLFYADEPADPLQPATWALDGETVRLQLPLNIDPTRDLVIDPFVTNTASLTGLDANKAIDIDFDYAGNIFVKGGGDGVSRKLAKYSATGVLQWTHTGVIALPSWSFGSYGGGWVVEKNTGKVYMGQGFNPSPGHIIVRIDAAGLYDNYVTTPNGQFFENWKMFWQCNNGSPQIITAGGGTNSNINLGICTPPSVVLSSANITNIPYTVGTGWAQDICDLAVDPINNDLYTLYGSLFGTPSLANQIYKNQAPYNGASVAWNVPSGFTTVNEISNRPYLSAAQMDNACNVLTVNSYYLYFYDGRNLKAFNKLNGTTVGTPLNLGTTALQQGGIVVDECNNVFVGSTTGTIKTYTFNGSVFNDAALADITIPGFATSAVYDLINNDAQKLLYACGNGFVASIDISSYGCASTAYTLSIVSDCVNLAATASLTPAPPLGSTITYLLFAGGAQVASNTTGLFTALQPNTTYTVHGIVNQTCSGVQTIGTFTLPSPNLSVTFTNTTCGSSSGTITAVGSAGAPPLSYSIDGVTFQASGLFTGIAAGVYTVYVRDNNSCRNSTVVQLVNSNGPQPSVTKTDASCGSANGSITSSATGGTPAYQFGLDGGAYQASGAFTNVAPGVHIITVKDATNCTNSASITVLSVGGTTVTTATTAAHCGNATGSITAIVSGGIPPYLYSLDGSPYGTSEIFTGVDGGVHVLTVKDANNCVNITNVNVINIPGATFTATASPTSCNAFTGTVTITATGGTAPLQYSTNNGGSFQASNLFTGLTAGTYNLVVRDASQCSTTSTVVVSLSIPQVTDSTTISSCNGTTGTITGIGTGGIPPYQYSLNGGAFQGSNVFGGLSSGTYTLTIRDAALCTNSITPVVVGNTSGLTISATTTNTSCTASTGTILTSANGGVAPLQYSLDGITWFASNSFTNLSAGQRTVRVRDTNLCLSTTVVTVGTTPGPSVISATTTPTSCNNAIGTITAGGTGGTAPYQFSIGGAFQASGSFTGLAPGPYTITVRDANLCTGTQLVSVTNNGGTTGPSLTSTVTTANCNQSDGLIHAIGSGGQGSLKYSIDGVNFSGGANFNNLPPGTYTIWVRDQNNCLNSIQVTVPNFPGPQVTAVVTASLCGAGTGTIVATGFGGAAPYRYSIDLGVNFQLSNTFTGLSGGFYTLTVRDNANICRNSITVFIPNSNGPTSSLVKTDATCGTNNGSITASATGGIPPLSYSVDGVNFQSSNVFPSLAPGPYTVVVKDATGCTNATSITVGNTASPTLITNLTPEACGSANGGISIIGSSGTAPYQYSLDGITYQSGSSFTGLTSGAYTITMRDASLCETSAQIVLTNVSGPTLTVGTIPATCSASNGFIIITGSGGTLPYQFSLDGVTWQSSFAFSNLAAGSYTARIKDAYGCTNSAACTVTTVAGTTLTWTGAVNTDWHNAANWGGCVTPNCKYNVVIPNGPVNQPVISTQNASARSVNISSSASLTLSPALQLMVCYDWQNNGSFSAGNGSTVLVQDTCLSCAGGIIHNQSMNGSMTGTNRFWHYTVTKPAGTQVLTGTSMDIGGNFTTTSATSIFNGNCRNLKVGGHFSNANGNTTFIPGTPNAILELNGSAPQNFIAGGILDLNHVLINNTGGGVTLVGSNMRTGPTGTFTLQQGLVITNAQEVFVRNNAPAAVVGGSTTSHVQGNLRRNLSGSSGSYDFPVGHALKGYQKANITFTTNTTIPDLLVNFQPYPVQPNGPVSSDCFAYDYSLSPVLDNGYWNINASANPASGTYDATLFNLNYTPVFAYPTVVKSSIAPPGSATWILSGACDPVNLLTATHRTSMNGFSAFGTGLSAISSLPVELISFTGHNEGDINVLEWITASELNNDYFILERSRDGEVFLAIATIDAAGNSQALLHYRSPDDHPFSGMNYYRLRQVDLGGSFTLSNIVALANADGKLTPSIYPNPTHDEAIIALPGSSFTLELFDAMGRSVLRTNSVSDRYVINGSDLAEGVYTVEVITTTGDRTRQRLVKQ